MVTRIISGVTMAVLGVIALIVGGRIAGTVVALIAIGAYYELCKACKVTNDNQKVNAITIVGYIAIVLFYTNLMWNTTDSRSTMYQLLLVCVVLAFLGVYVFAYPKYNSNQIMAGAFNLFYAPLLLAFLYPIMTEFENGKFLLLLVFVASSISDACAYFVGVSLGKHKLAPKLSPKKSIEGSIGGIAGAAIVGAIYGLVTHKLGIFAESNVIGIFALIGAFGSVISQIGDLAASAIKRDADIKDYSKLIPGHGGIMDRMDSILVCAPIIYFLCLFFM